VRRVLRSLGVGSMSFASKASQLYFNVRSVLIRRLWGRIVLRQEAGSNLR
jgi:hypothetical protein